MKIATLFTRYGKIEIELFEEDAPNTVANFCKLAESGFYDGLTFHKYVHDVLVQGGCPKGDGTGGAGYLIKCETNGERQTHDQGTVSMAHCGKDTGSSQFFISLNRRYTAQFDGVHTCFGKVNKGFVFIDNLREGDVIERIIISEE